MRQRILAFTVALAAVVMSTGYASGVVPTARVSGDGSTVAGNEVMDWVAAVKQQGATVDYNPDGDTSGLSNFAANLNDYAVTSLPFGALSGVPQPTGRAFSYAPVAASPIGFMYNVNIGGSQFTGLRLSQAVVAGIFSGQITQWNAPKIAASNPGVTLPAQKITVVVHSEQSGATLTLTQWMKNRFPAQYDALCATAGCDPSTATSSFPTQNMSNFVAVSGSQNVTTYTANTPYAINYDEYSYALGAGFPVASLSNTSGHYVQPGATNASLSLSHSSVNTGGLVDLTGAFTAPEPSAYPLVMPYYALVATAATGISSPKAATLVYFLVYGVCRGQATAAALGYAPITPNLVEDTFAVLRGLSSVHPALDTSAATLANCSGNPTLRMTNVARPTFSGIVRAGQTVTASVGRWTPTPTSYSFQWRSNGRPIYRATNRSFTIPHSLGGTYLSVTVTAHLGAAASTSSTSLSRLIPATPFAELAAPHLYGSLRVGSTIHVYLGRWSPGPSISIRWYENGFEVATNRTYHYLGGTSAGTQIRVVLLLTKPGYVSRRIVLTGAHLVAD